MYFQTTRKTWEIDLDISAPQIFLVEQFDDEKSVLCVIDLGKFHFTNSGRDANTVVANEVSSLDDDDDDEGRSVE